jgi:hypothetical protein
MAWVTRTGVSFDMGNDLLGGDYRSAVVAVGQLLEGWQSGLADSDEGSASAFANGVVAIGHLVAEDLDPSVDGRVGFFGRFLFCVRFIGCIALAGRLGGRRTEDK